MNKIIDFLKKLSFRDIIIAILAVMCIVTFINMRYWKGRAIESEKQFVDTLSVYKNKLGEEYTARQIQI